jgi:twinkle protein
MDFDSIRPKHEGPEPEAKADPAAPLIDPASVLEQALHHWDHGNPNGSPTHYPTIDKHWLWQPGEACAITGWPGHGKSLAELNKMVTKAVYDDWKFGLFVPENMPLHKATAILVQAYVGKSANPKHTYKMTRAEYEAAVKWVAAHFTFIDPRLAHSLKTLLPAVKAAKKFGIKGWLLDPWNDLESKLGEFSGMMSEQLKAQLGLVLDFTKDENLCTLICVHPAGEARNPKTLELKVPDQYSMEGGRMWPNRMDSIVVWHRPMADEDPTDSQVDLRVRKMRNEPESGFKTPKDGVRLNYMRQAFRYIDPLLGMSPLDPIAIERYRRTGSTDAPVPAQQAPLYGIRTHQQFSSEFPQE